MAAPAPPRPVVMARQHGHGRTNSAAAGGQHQRTSTQILSAPRAAPARLKVMIRRLPPGLSQTEFCKALGDEWKQGGERVDWLSFKEGKVSKDISKASRPGRAYLHLTKADFLSPFSTVVKEANFADIKNTTGDTCLLGPPTLEFSSYGRIPTFKPRKDGRQGTIDQDLEFIDFLQELTNPVVRPVPLDTAEKGNGTTNGVTPLVQYLRDKKANKAKETAPTKGAKQARQDTKDAKGKAVEKEAKTKESKETPTPEQKKTPAAIKVEKAARDAVKVLSKQAAAVQKAAQNAVPTQPAKAQPAPSETSQPPTAPAERKRGKVGAEAKNLLQRDLGLVGVGGRRRRGEAAGAPNASGNPPTAVAANKPVQSSPASQAATSTTNNKPVSTNTNKAATTAPAAAPTGPATTQVPTGPAASRAQPKPQPQANGAKNNHAGPNAAKEPVPTTPAAAIPATPSTQAFLKHANPSQGVTEPLLQEAFAPFGAIQKVEIDKKKGFAYIDFAEPDGLQKAISASPVKVAQGQVVVLERKDGKAAQARPRGGRGPAGRGRGGRGGGTIGRSDKPLASQAAATAPASSEVKT